MLGVIRLNTICKLCASALNTSNISSRKGRFVLHIILISLLDISTHFRWLLEGIKNNIESSYYLQPSMGIFTTSRVCKKRKSAEERVSLQLNLNEIIHFYFYRKSLE